MSQWYSLLEEHMAYSKKRKKILPDKRKQGPVVYNTAPVLVPALLLWRDTMIQATLIKVSI